MPITAAGTMPATIIENARPGDWSAAMVLSGLTRAADVMLTGANANAFEASLDAAGTSVTITPRNGLDREFYSASTAAVLTFGLTVLVAGTWQAVSGSWSVTLLGVDDAPPAQPVFVSGGTILETDAGGVVGRMVASDPDSTTGALEWRVLWPDAAEFTFEGSTLRLRDGVDLLRQGGTTRTVLVGVSDGRNEVSYAVSVGVVNVTNEDGPPLSPPPPPPPPLSPPPAISASAAPAVSTAAAPSTAAVAPFTTRSRHHLHGDGSGNRGRGRRCGRQPDLRAVPQAGRPRHSDDAGDERRDARPDRQRGDHPHHHHD